MYLAELVVFFLFCYNVAGFSLHGHGKRLNHVLREINGPVALSDSLAIEMNFITQPLDHFDENEHRILMMKYFQRLDKWVPNGPIYLFINGINEATYTWLTKGLLYDLAVETKGAMFLTEHRYYGESKPLKITKENQKFLSSRQALADNAKLLKKIKLLPSFNSSKAVVVGGSYAGNLAAWMKLLYPDLVDAAIASSAPVLAKANFFEYLETVGDDIEQYGTPGCYDNVRKKFERYENLLKTDDGIKILKEEERICDETDMHKLENQQLFFYEKTERFMDNAQYGDLGSINRTCEDMFNSSRGFSLQDFERQVCYEYDFDMYIRRDLEDFEMTKMWLYQTCTEFGYYQTFDSKKQPFTNNVPEDFFYKQCAGVFGPEFDGKRVNEAVSKTNEMYGGISPNVTQVVFVNGLFDPWHRLSVLKDLSSEAPAIVTPYSSNFLYPERSDDSEELKEARKHVKDLIKKWIGAGENVNTNQ